MAGMSLPPETHYLLPEEFAAALGQAVATFGWLEEVLKRALFSLERVRLAKDLSAPEMGRWRHHMTDIADDSLGTLIEQLDGALRRHPGIADRDQLNDRLVVLKHQRNLICHASWSPTADKARWRPAFVAMKGESVPDTMSAAELDGIRHQTEAAGRRLIAIMRMTGIAGEWIGEDGGPEHPA